MIFEWFGFFPEKPPCAFLVLIVRNIHAKKLRNRARGSPGNLGTNQLTNQPEIRSLTSTDVENCNLDLVQWLNVRTCWTLGPIKPIKQVNLVKPVELLNLLTSPDLLNFTLQWPCLTRFWLLHFLTFSMDYSNMHLRFLNHPLWPDKLVECLRTVSTITICNIKWI